MQKKGAHFLLGKKQKKKKNPHRVREGEKREMKNQNFSLRFTEFYQSEFVGPRMKVYLLEEGYLWVEKTQDFAKDSSEEFGK